MAGGLATPADTEMLGPTKAAPVSDNSQPWGVHGTTECCEPRDARHMVDYRLCDWSSALCRNTPDHVTCVEQQTASM